MAGLTRRNAAARSLRVTAPTRAAVRYSFRPISVATAVLRRLARLEPLNILVEIPGKDNERQ